MGHNARMVAAGNSFKFDADTGKPEPNTTPRYAPMACAGVDATYCFNKLGGKTVVPGTDGSMADSEKRRHKLVGSNSSLTVNSLCQRFTQGGGGEEDDIHGQREQLELSKYDRSQSAPEGSDMRRGSGVAPQLTMKEQQQQYDQQRQLVTEVQRLRSVEEHEKRLQGELASCKEMCSAYEGQVITLTERLSLREGGHSDALSMKLESKNEELLKEIAYLKTELSRKEKNITKLKEKVKSQTVGAVLGEDPQGSQGSTGLQGSSLQTSGKSFGEEHERELAKLYQEMRVKDEQNKENNMKLEEMAKNMAALMTMRQKSSAAIKALKDECEKEKVCHRYRKFLFTPLSACPPPHSKLMLSWLERRRP